MPLHIGNGHRNFVILLYLDGKVNVTLPHRYDRCRDESWEAFTTHADTHRNEVRANTAVSSTAKVEMTDG